MSLEADFDANVNRLKACEHIADGDEGWEALRNECPSTAAVARLRDDLEGTRRERKLLSWALRAKDAAMSVLFDRLHKAGVDCSDLIP